MMHLQDLSIWGGIVVALLLGAAAGLFWLLDRRLLKKILHVNVVPAIANVPLRLMPALTVGWIVGAMAAAGCVMLTLRGGMFWPVVVILLLCLIPSAPWGLLTYLRSLKHTEAHRRYLLANGANHAESVIPSARRALRAAVMPMLWHRSSAMPLAMAVLCCGLKMSGMSIAAAVALTLLLWAAAIVASVLTCLLTIWLADYSLFDKHENIIAEGNS